MSPFDQLLGVPVTLPKSTGGRVHRTLPAAPDKQPLNRVKSTGETLRQERPLRIVKALAAGAKTAREVATELGLDGEATRTFLNLGVDLGVFRKAGRKPVNAHGTQPWLYELAL